MTFSNTVPSGLIVTGTASMLLIQVLPEVSLCPPPSTVTVGRAETWRVSCRPVLAVIVMDDLRVCCSVLEVTVVWDPLDLSPGTRGQGRG